MAQKNSNKTASTVEEVPFAVVRREVAVQGTPRAVGTFVTEEEAGGMWGAWLSEGTLELVEGEPIELPAETEAE